MRNVITFGWNMSAAASRPPEWEEVLLAAARLQGLLPGAVLDLTKWEDVRKASVRLALVLFDDEG